MADQTSQGDPTPQAPPEGTSKMGIACVGMLVLFVLAILAAVAFLGPR